ncbi:MAG: polymorphic toxin-type HINT domain-containing protein [Pirellulaceae bacterium]
MSRCFGLVAVRGLFLACTAAMLAIPLAAFGETQAQKSRGAEQQVQEALQREIYGLESDRQELLAAATKKVPGYAPAMWQLGYLKDQRNRWVKADDYLLQGAASAPLSAYQRVRGNYPDTAEGQLALAKWCEEKKLLNQAWAHLNRVLELEPNHLAARAALGFERIGGLWVSREERATDGQLALEERQSLAKYGEAMREIAAGLAKESPVRREAAAKKLMAIRDAAAIPAMEALVSPVNDEAARLVVDALAAMSDPAASLSLARHAVYYPSHAIRDAAAKKLISRDKHGYAPQLIAMLYLPVRTEVVADVLPSGRIGYRHSFAREGHDRNEVLVLDTEYFRVAQAGGDAGLSAARAGLDAAQTATERELAVEAQNRFQSQLNDRITLALKIATEQNLPAQPESWWRWWNDYNELLTQGPKTVITSQEYRTSAVVDIVQTGSRGSGGGTSQVAITGECLVAGTPVWTASGLLAVEKIKVGDLVLSQDAETGELALRPVLRTTIRPRGPTVKFTAGQESFEASGGHPFWVSGDGWRKASELRSGMVLHACGSPARVTSVEEGSIAETYNLVVAVFSTYFVGRQKILSHDFTMRQPSPTVVPGLRGE